MLNILLYNHIQPSMAQRLRLMYRRAVPSPVVELRQVDNQDPE